MKLNEKKVSVSRSVRLVLILSPEVRVSCVVSAFIPFRDVLPAFTIHLMTLSCLRLCFLVFATSPQFLYVHGVSALCLPFPFPTILTLCLTLVDLPHILTTHAHLYTCQNIRLKDCNCRCSLLSCRSAFKTHPLQSVDCTWAGSRWKNGPYRRNKGRKTTRSQAGASKRVNKLENHRSLHQRYI